MDWMAAEGYAESKVAMHYILQNSKSDKADPFIPYLAMNLFGRFISRHQLPTVIGRVRDDIVLAAESCLTIAWGMRDKSFSYDQFVDKRRRDNWFGKPITAPYIENRSEQFQRKIDLLIMEKMILEELEWKIDVATPVEYVGFFVRMIPIGKGIKVRIINEIVIQTQGDVSFTRFLPPVIAASAVLTAFEIIYVDSDEEWLKMGMLAAQYVDEDQLMAFIIETRKLCIENPILLGDEDKPAMKERDPNMNFELKWRTGISEDPEEWTINSPDFQTRALDPAEGRVETRNHFDSICDAAIAPFRSCTIL